MPRNILDTFEPYAMVQPKSETDVLALLDEAIAEAQNLNMLLEASLGSLALQQRLRRNPGPPAQR